MTALEIYSESPIAARWEGVDKKDRINAEMVVNLCAKYFQVSASDMKMKWKPTHIVYPRQVCIYVLCVTTTLSLKKIGAIFSKDHTTVISSREKIKSDLTVYQNVINDVNAILEQIDPSRQIKNKIRLSPVMVVQPVASKKIMTHSEYRSGLISQIKALVDMGVRERDIVVKMRLDRNYVHSIRMKLKKEIKNN